MSASALFDSDWYKATYPDVAAAGVDPLRHYLLKGASESRAPSPLFDPAYYLKTYPDVASSGLNPLVHYLRFGQQEDRACRQEQHSGDAAATDSSESRDLILDSGFFDEAWYRATYPDVSAAGVDPLTHYLESGLHEGRVPSQRFDPEFYLKTYPDVAAAGVNPLIHYLEAGRQEGRKIRQWSPDTRLIEESGLFDDNWYRTAHPDVEASGMDPLEHYVDIGANIGYAPGPLFDPADFLKRHPDIAALGRRPLTWFLESDPSEQRNAQSVCSEPAEDRWGRPPDTYCSSYVQAAQHRRRSARLLP